MTTLLRSPRVEDPKHGEAARAYLERKDVAWT